MSDPNERNILDDINTIQNVVRKVREMAFMPDAVFLGPCYRRPESRQFMMANGFLEHDITSILSELDVEDYCCTSVKPDNPNAYVFGVSYYLVDFLIYLKLQVVEGIVIISFHEPIRPLEFPFKEG